ncbi:putative cell morphogenesis protein las1 [Phaeomoniella chlamydospora]|uniref:Putative cell morphogenesis protein las1 n=1 Tax=Phaeomoniella chlamydospora TaxID=158046 RepID=A0A0G2GXM4_PHACM|nr:putative cell morphogenesis protein las1 [Phaeomoniella chlamydospora]
MSIEDTERILDAVRDLLPDERSAPWYTLSELAMVRSFFYPDRSPLDPPRERPTTPYRDSSGRFINTFIPPSFAELDANFLASKMPAEVVDSGANGFSYFRQMTPDPNFTGTKKEEFVPRNPENCRLIAINMVQSVLDRFGPNELSHAVIATSQLTAALLHEERMLQKRRENDYDCVTRLSVESTLAGALSKFVTGLVDRDIKLDMKEEKVNERPRGKKRKSEDTNGTGKQEDIRTKQSNSMLSNAAQIGLPAAFVELRHQITHEEMPKIPQMKLMAFRALDWLWAHYWHGLDVGDDEWGIEERERLQYIKEKTNEMMDQVCDYTPEEDLHGVNAPQDRAQANTYDPGTRLYDLKVTMNDR